MNVRLMLGAFALVLLAALTVRAQNAATHEKLYISLENTDQMAIVDVASNKIIKTLKVANHPHGLSSPRAQDRLYVASEIDGTVTLFDTTRDEVIKTFNVGFGVEPQENDITPDGRFLYQPSYAGYWNVFDTQKEEIVEYIHTRGIAHNTLISPDGRQAFLFPIAGGEGHFKRPSLGLPRTQPKEVTVVDTSSHKVVGTIPLGTGPRPPVFSPDGRRIYMNVDDLLGFLVIDVAARKVISKATYTLTADEQAVRSRSHGITVTPDGREVWSNNVVHNFVHVFDVTVDPPKQVAKLATGRQPYWNVTSKDGRTIYVACPSSDVVLVFDRATKMEKGRIAFPAGSRPTRMLVVAAPRRSTTSLQ
jgi:DNA-binding beta-propeller fold protein YncE